MGQSDAKQEDGTCHIMEEFCLLPFRFGAQMLHGIPDPTSIFPKVAEWNRKDGVLGAPYHPFSTPWKMELHLIGCR